MEILPSGKWAVCGVRFLAGINLHDYVQGARADYGAVLIQELDFFCFPV